MGPWVVAKHDLQNTAKIPPFRLCHWVAYPWCLHLESSLPPLLVLSIVWCKLWAQCLLQNATPYHEPWRGAYTEGSLVRTANIAGALDMGL